MKDSIGNIKLASLRLQDYTVVVNNDDIQYGLRWNSERCPIARAFQRAYGELMPELEVGGDGIYIYAKDGVAAWSISNEVISFIEDFDRGEPVAPFKFVATFVEATVA